MADAERLDMVNRLMDGIDAGDVSVMDEVFHEDAVIEWPGSRERVVGAANRREIYSRMPTLPKVSGRRVRGGGDIWVFEARFTYGDDSMDAILVFEFRGDRIARQTAYFARIFEAPTWRSAWVERT